MAETYYYCPKCSRKKLVKDNKWSRDHGTYFRIWKCTNQPSKQMAKLKEGIDKGEVTGTSGDYYSYYSSYEAKHGDANEKTIARKAEYDKCVAYFKANPPCDVEISVHDRDARIVDYFSVLDLLIRDGEAIQHHLLETHSGVYRRGMEVLYSSEQTDIVRYRDGHGVAIWLYWKCTWEPNRNKNEINWRALTTGAAGYMTHRGTELPVIFRNDSRFALWAKEKDSSSWYRNVPFSGKLTKKTKAEIVDWVKDLEKNLSAYEEKAAADDQMWQHWYKTLRTETEALSGRISIRHFDGEQKEAQINIQGWLPPEKVKAIAAIVGSRTLANEILARESA